MAINKYLARAINMGKNGLATGAGMGSMGLNVADSISRIPWYVAVPGAALIANAASFGSPKQQSRSTGPTSMQARPGWNSSSSLSDMGASGDLVFSLHQNGH